MKRTITTLFIFLLLPLFSHASLVNVEGTFSVIVEYNGSTTDPSLDIRANNSTTTVLCHATSTRTGLFGTLGRERLEDTGTATTTQVLNYLFPVPCYVEDTAVAWFQDTAYVYDTDGTYHAGNGGWHKMYGNSYNSKGASVVVHIPVASGTPVIWTGSGYDYWYNATFTLFDISTTSGQTFINLLNNVASTTDCTPLETGLRKDYEVALGGWTMLFCVVPSKMPFNYITEAPRLYQAFMYGYLSGTDTGSDTWTYNYGEASTSLQIINSNTIAQIPLIQRMRSIMSMLLYIAFAILIPLRIIKLF